MTAPGLSVAQHDVHAVRGERERSNGDSRRGGTSAQPTGFVYTLSEQARVLFTIHRIRPGRRVGNHCVKPTRTNRRKKECNRYKRLGRFADSASAGPNTKSWAGKIGRKRALPGRYRGTLTATDTAGNKSAPRRIRFRVVRR